jgi:hypothetical protein
LSSGCSQPPFFIGGGGGGGIGSNNSDVRLFITEASVFSL